MEKYVVFGMMMQAAITGTLSGLGALKLSTGQQLTAAVLYCVVLGLCLVGRR